MSNEALSYDPDDPAEKRLYDEGLAAGAGLLAEMLSLLESEPDETDAPTTPMKPVTLPEMKVPMNDDVRRKVHGNPDATLQDTPQDAADAYLTPEGQQKLTRLLKVAGTLDPLPIGEDKRRMVAETTTDALDLMRNVVRGKIIPGTKDGTRQE